jgi:hypothetical protein
MRQKTIRQQSDFLSNTHDPSQLEPHEILEPLDEDSQGERTEIIYRLFGIILPQSGASRERLMEISFRRFCALVYTIAPERLGATSQTEVAEKLGFSSAAFSKICIELSVHLGIQPRALRTIGARVHPADSAGGDRVHVGRKQRDGKIMSDARKFFERGKPWLAHHREMLMKHGLLGEEGKLTREGIGWLAKEVGE